MSAKADCARCNFRCEYYTTWGEIHTISTDSNIYWLCGRCNKDYNDEAAKLFKRFIKKNKEHELYEGCLCKICQGES